MSRAFVYTNLCVRALTASDGGRKTAILYAGRGNGAASVCGGGTGTDPHLSDIYALFVFVCKRIE